MRHRDFIGRGDAARLLSHRPLAGEMMARIGPSEVWRFGIRARQVVARMTSSRPVQIATLDTQRRLSRRALFALLAAPALPGGASIGLVGLASKVRGSVCAVGTFDSLASPRFAFRGTGFFIGDGRTLVTCWHVLPQSRPVEPAAGRLVAQVVDASGVFEHLDAEVVASDPRHDLALLRVSGAAKPALDVAVPDNVQEGMSVMFVGFPIGGMLGFNPVTHRGIVSSIVSSSAPPPTAQRLTPGAVRHARDGAFVLIQLDATAYPGNSGGPLVDIETGRVVGVVNMVLLKGNRESALTNPSGISYAVPTRYLGQLLAGR